MELVFVGIFLYFNFWLLFTMEKFKGRAIERRCIERADLKQTIWRIIKRMVFTFGLFILLFFLTYLFDEDFKLSDLYLILQVCPAGLLFFTLFGLSGYMLTLRGTFRLPFVDGEANE